MSIQGQQQGKPGGVPNGLESFCRSGDPRWIWQIPSRTGDGFAIERRDLATLKIVMLGFRSTFHKF